MSGELNVHLPIIYCPDCTRRVVNNPEALAEFDAEDSHHLLCSCQQILDEPVPDVELVPPTTPPQCLTITAEPPETVSLRMSEKRDATLAVRRWSKVWNEEFGLDYPQVLLEMVYDPPRAIYKALKLDKELLEIKLEAHTNAARERSTRKIAYSVSRDMLRYKNHPPRYFQYHNASTNVLCPEMTREEFWHEFWFMLSDEERTELIEENYEVEVSNIVSRTRTKAAISHFQQCMRCIKGGLEAIRLRMRVSNMSKQQYIDQFFVSRKRKRDAAARKEFEDIIFEDYPLGEDGLFNGETLHE